MAKHISQKMNLRNKTFLLCTHQR